MGASLHMVSYPSQSSPRFYLRLQVSKNSKAISPHAQVPFKTVCKFATYCTISQTNHMVKACCQYESTTQRHKYWKKRRTNLGYNCNQSTMKGIITGVLHLSHCTCVFNYLFHFKETKKPPKKQKNKNKTNITDNMGIVHTKKTIHVCVSPP